MAININIPDQNVFLDQDLESWESWLSSQDDTVVQAFQEYVADELQANPDFSGVPSYENFMRVLDDCARLNQITFTNKNKSRMGGGGLLTAGSATDILTPQTVPGTSVTSQYPKPKAKDVNFKELRFSLDNAEFIKWLFNGMLDYGIPTKSGGLMVNHQDFNKDLQDRTFGGVRISSRQADFLASVFQSTNIQLSHTGYPVSAINPDKKSVDSDVLRDVDRFFYHCRLEGIEAEADDSLQMPSVINIYSELMYGRKAQEDENFGNFIADKFTDTGTDEDSIEEILRFYQNKPRKWESFKEQVGLDFRAHGSSFEDIITREFTGGREVGYVTGIIQSANRGENYYIGRALGPMGTRLQELHELGAQVNPDDQASIEAHDEAFYSLYKNCFEKLTGEYQDVFHIDPNELIKIENVQLLALLTSCIRTFEQYENEFPACLENYGLHPPADLFCLKNLLLPPPGAVILNNVDTVTSYFRQNPRTQELAGAYHDFMMSLDEVLKMVRQGKTPADWTVQQFVKNMGLVEREFEIFKTSEEAGREQIERSYQAAEVGTYTAVGASVAILTGVYVLAPGGFAMVAGLSGVEGTAVAVASGIGAGTSAELGLRTGVAAVRSDVDVTTESFLDDMNESSTNAACATLSLVVGAGMTQVAAQSSYPTLSRIASNPIARGIMTNEAVALGNETIRWSGDYGLDDLFIMGASGTVAGLAEPLLHNSAVSELVFEMNREGFENIVEAHCKYGGKVGPEEIIGAIAAAFTELGGSYKGGNVEKAQQIQLMLQMAEKMQVYAKAKGLDFEIDIDAIRRGKFDPDLLFAKAAELQTQAASRGVHERSTPIAAQENIVSAIEEQMEALDSGPRPVRGPEAARCDVFSLEQMSDAKIVVYNAEQWMHVATARLRHFEKSGQILSNENFLQTATDQEIGGYQPAADILAKFLKAYDEQKADLEGLDPADSDYVYKKRLLKLENDFIENVLRPALAANPDSLFIFCARSNSFEATLSHELSHIQFATDRVFASAVHRFWFHHVSAADQASFAQFMRDHGYESTSQIENEFQAYVLMAMGERHQELIGGYQEKYHQALVDYLQEQGLDPIALQVRSAVSSDVENSQDIQLEQESVSFKSHYHRVINSHRVQSAFERQQREGGLGNDMEFEIYVNELTGEVATVSSTPGRSDMGSELIATDEDGVAMSVEETSDAQNIYRSEDGWVHYGHAHPASDGHTVEPHVDDIVRFMQENNDEHFIFRHDPQTGDVSWARLHYGEDGKVAIEYSDPGMNTAEVKARFDQNVDEAADQALFGDPALRAVSSLRVKAPQNPTLMPGKLLDLISGMGIDGEGEAHTDYDGARFIRNRDGSYSVGNIAESGYVRVFDSEGNFECMIHSRAGVMLDDNGQPFMNGEAYHVLRPGDIIQLPNGKAFKFEKPKWVHGDKVRVYGKEDWGECTVTGIMGDRIVVQLNNGEYKVLSQQDVDEVLEGPISRGPVFDESPVLQGSRKKEITTQVEQIQENQQIQLENNQVWVTRVSNRVYIYDQRNVGTKIWRDGKLYEMRDGKVYQGGVEQEMNGQWFELKFGDRVVMGGEEFDMLAELNPVRRSQDELSASFSRDGSITSEIRVNAKQQPEITADNVHFTDTAIMPNGQKLNFEVLQEMGLGPKHKCIIEGREVWLSQVTQFDTKGRVTVIAYVKRNDGRWAVRTYYKSNSHISWKVMTHYVQRDGQIKLYGKGYDQDSVSLPISAQVILNQVFSEQNLQAAILPQGQFEAQDVFAGTAPQRAMRLREQEGVGNITFMGQVEAMPVQIDSSCYSAERINGHPDPSQMHPGGEPNSEVEPADFSKPDSTFEVYSAIYGGMIQGEVFTSRDGSLRYLFYRDKLGRVWIGSIELTSSQVGDHGVYRQWVAADALTTPAYEYTQELEAYYSNYNLRSGGYVDSFDLFLRHIPIIQRYYQETGLAMPTSAQLGNAR